jgi:predicted nucleic acid-binding Zn ribbon protein
MSASGMQAGEAQRRRVRRSALLWALIAAAFYLGFIVLAVTRGMK